MAIRYSAEPRPFFPPMALASTWCRGVGVELGAASHNRFDLPGAINVAPAATYGPDFDDHVFYCQAQEQLCGACALVDVAAEAHATTLADSSQDYVISSHVVEHLPNLIAAFVEWHRILRDGGVVFMIFPRREAHPPDRGRPVTELGHFISDFEREEGVDTHPLPPDGRRGHYHIFTLASMRELVAWCRDSLGLRWEVVAEEETDSKVGNGHTLVCRVSKPALAEAAAGAADEPRRRGRPPGAAAPAG